MKNAMFSRANRVRRARVEHSLESLESRQMLATYSLSDYFPTSTTASWTYSGTSGGVAASGTLHFTSGGGNITESFSGNSGGLSNVSTRIFQVVNGGLNVIQTEREPGADDFVDAFPAGYAWLPATFSDGSSPLSTFSGVTNNLTYGISGVVQATATGQASGSITVLPPTTLTTPAGTFQAIQVQELSSSTRTSGGQTYNGVYNLSVWLVKGLGIARISLDSTETLQGQNNNNPFITDSYDVSLTSTTYADIKANVAVTGNGNAIVNGSTSPVRTNNTGFNVGDINGGGINKTFTITNSGTQLLHLSNDFASAVTITGANAADFTLVSAPAATVQPGKSTTFTIQFKPSATGLRNAVVTVNSRSLNNGTYTFAVRGTGQYFGVMGVQGGVNPVAITSGATTASFTNGTRFGAVPGDGNHAFGRRFIISNSGTGLFNLTGSPKIMITGAGAANFSVLADPADSVGAGGSTVFRIRFHPLAAGFTKAFVTILNDSTNTPMFTFAITGTGT